MTIKNRKSIDFLVASDTSALKNILTKLELINKLNAALAKYLEPDLRAHCQVANYRDGQIVIQVDSPVFATLLRFQLPHLLSLLRKEPGLAGITSLQHIVRPIASTAVLKSYPEIDRKLSVDNAAYLQDLALTISDEKLKAVLEHIAKLGKA